MVDPDELIGNSYDSLGATARCDGCGRKTPAEDQVLRHGNWLCERCAK